MSPPRSTDAPQTESGGGARPGVVYLVGAGPGDPGLMTARSLELIATADAILHDRLIPAGALAGARADAELIYVGKAPGRVAMEQADTEVELVRIAREGRSVVRLKGGDPFVFGRGGEEGEACVAAGVPIRVIPGITAGIGGLASAGIPVTHGAVNSAVTFVTGHDAGGDTPPLDWVAIAQASPVIVIYMGMRNLAEIAAKLVAAGRGADEPVAVVQNASTPDQRVLVSTLAQVADAAAAAGIGSPAVVCVGATVPLRAALDWQATGTE